MFRGLRPAVTSFALAPMLFLSATAHAQSKSPSPKAAGEPGGFSAKGLNYETELTALYLGDFSHARLQRDGAEFDFLFGNYLKAFARRCSASLREQSRDDQTGVRPGAIHGQPVRRRTGPPTCVEYRQVGTGLYADPDLYAAQQKVEVEVGRNMVRDTFRDMSGNNPMATGMRAVDAATSVGRDMDSLLAEQLRESRTQAISGQHDALRSRSAAAAPSRRRDARIDRAEEISRRSLQGLQLQPAPR